MEVLLQFCRILMIALASEVLHEIIPLPIPASIYGIVILFLLLETGLLRLDKVYTAGKFLIEIMPVMFVPAAAGLMVNWDIIRPALPVYVAIVAISTVLVMGVAGTVTQLLIRRRKDVSDDAGNADKEV